MQTVFLKSRHWNGRLSLFSVCILSIWRIFNQHSTISSAKRHMPTAYFCNEENSSSLITVVPHCSSALNYPQNALWNCTFEAGSERKTSPNRIVEVSAHAGSWMNYQNCHVTDCSSNNLDNQKKHSHLRPCIPEREGQARRESERESRERAFWLLKKTQPADSLASILLSARWIIDKSANTLKQRGGNTRCMSIMPLNRPSTRTNNSIYETSTASDLALCFFPSWIRARMRLVNILTFLPYCASNLSFISTSLSENHRVNVYSYLLYIFINLLLSTIDVYIYIRKAVRQDLNISLVTWYYRLSSFDDRIMYKNVRE